MGAGNGGARCAGIIDEDTAAMRPAQPSFRGLPAHLQATR